MADALTSFFKLYSIRRVTKGDEVIVPANTYIASILAILEAFNSDFSRAKVGNLHH
jgi:dTDP-4-amino-4,6-dideoxygalactose transaminase